MMEIMARLCAEQFNSWIGSVPSNDGDRGLYMARLYAEQFNSWIGSVLSYSILYNPDY